MLGYLVRRLLWAAGTVVLTAFFAYGVIRLLRPDRYERPSVRAVVDALRAEARAVAETHRAA